MKREDLKPSLQGLPRWLLILSAYLIAFPSHVMIGAIEGIANGLYEIREAHKIENLPTE